MAIEVKFKIFPDGELRSIDVAKVEEVLQVGVAEQAGLKLRGGEVVVVLHSTREALQMLRDADLPPLPKLDSTKIMELVAERARQLQQASPNINEAHALAGSIVVTLCEEINQLLAEALQ